MKKNILYVETEAILKKDIEWTWYLDKKETKNIWNKYKSKSKELAVIAPYQEEICLKNQKDLVKIGNVHSLKNEGISLKEIKNIYDSKLKQKKDLEEKIKFDMKMKICSPDIDLVIIGSTDNFYKQVAIDICKKNNKIYIIEHLGTFFKCPKVDI